MSLAIIVMLIALVGMVAMFWISSSARRTTSINRQHTTYQRQRQDLGGDLGAAGSVGSASSYENNLFDSDRSSSASDSSVGGGGGSTGDWSSRSFDERRSASESESSSDRYSASDSHSSYSSSDSSSSSDSYSSSDSSSSSSDSSSSSSWGD